MANSWRTTAGLNDGPTATWDGIVRGLDNNAGLGRFAGPGGWNNMDVLVVRMLPALFNTANPIHGNFPLPCLLEFAGLGLLRVHPSFLLCAALHLKRTDLSSTACPLMLHVWPPRERLGSPSLCQFLKKQHPAFESSIAGGRQAAASPHVAPSSAKLHGAQQA